jgi:DNA-binding NtrC family response regulator
MSKNHSETTLPTLRDAIARSTALPRLQCTIVFHPKVERIGQSALLELAGGDIVLGRLSPSFSETSGKCPGPLEDPYISRRAVIINVETAGVRLRRPPDASRCQVAGAELQDELLLDNDWLSAGVALQLSHSVVLMLRSLVPRCFSAPVLSRTALVGSSEAMLHLRDQVSRAANNDLDVLIRGETGTGKELVAQAIHQNSARSGGPLVSVNMAAIPTSLASALLFGNAKGAFSGADRARQGYFQQAEGGTLFLDEVGDTPTEVQPLLLRALQQREIQVVGGEVRKADVRVISATDANLESSDCGFKSALRHRLGAAQIDLPPLRAHPEDVGELLYLFLARACEREQRRNFLPAHSSSARSIARWTNLFAAFANYHWPGNIRQLENFANQIVVNSDQDLVLPDIVTSAMTADAADEQRLQSTGAVRESSPSPRNRSRPVPEAQFEEAMHRGSYEVAAVADDLGVSRRTIYRRIDNSGRFRRVSDVPLAEVQDALNLHGGDMHKAALEMEVSASGLLQRMRALRSEARGTLAG